MENKEKKFYRMKKVIDLLRKEKDETLGGLKQVQKEAKEKFGCRDLKSIQKKKKKLKKKKSKYDCIIKKQMEEFEKQFGRLVTAIEKDSPKIHRIAKQCLKGKEAGKGKRKKVKKRS
jgi:hypothetical protein